jgi:hypothetical protein
VQFHSYGLLGLGLRTEKIKHHKDASYNISRITKIYIYTTTYKVFTNRKSQMKTMLKRN